MKNIITKEIVSEISNLYKSNNPFPIARKISTYYNSNNITLDEYNFLSITIIDEVIKQKILTPAALRMVKHLLNCQ